MAQQCCKLRDATVLAFFLYETPESGIILYAKVLPSRTRAKIIPT
jgi:hypothetical protein